VDPSKKTVKRKLNLDIELAKAWNAESETEKEEKKRKENLDTLFDEICEMMMNLST